MSSIIEDIFVSTLEEDLPDIIQENKKDEEYEIYTNLCKTLNEEYKKLFIRFVELYGARIVREEKLMFQRGFKKGLLIAFEAFNLN